MPFFTSIHSSGWHQGPVIAICCPKCKEHVPDATTHETLETVKLFWSIQLFKKRTVKVQCGQCHTPWITNQPLEQLIIASDNGDWAFIQNALNATGTTAQKILAVCSVLASVVVFFGLPICLLALAMNRKNRDWTFSVSLASTLVAIVTSVLLSIAIF